MPKITRYLIDDAGVDHQQFWPGRSAMGSGYDEVAVGQGDTAGEALEDALDQLAEMDYDVNAIPADPKDFNRKDGLTQQQLNDGEFSYYVAVFVR